MTDDLYPTQWKVLPPDQKDDFLLAQVRDLQKRVIAAETNLSDALKAIEALEAKADRLNPE